MTLDKWLTLIAQFAPLVFAVVPGGATLAPLTPLIIDGIMAAEQIHNASGAEKKAHVQTIVANAVAVTNTVTGNTTLDPALTLAASSASIDAVIATVKVIEAAQAGVVPAVADAPGVKDIS